MSAKTTTSRQYLTGALLMPFALQALFITIKMSGTGGFYYPGSEPTWAITGACCGVILLLRGLTRYRGLLALVYAVITFFLLMGFSGLFMTLFYGMQSTPVY